MWRSARFEVGHKYVVVLPDDGPMQLWSLRIRGNADIREVLKDEAMFKMQKQFETMCALGFSAGDMGKMYTAELENAHIEVIIRNSRIVRIAVNGVNAASLTIARETKSVVAWEAWVGELYETMQRREKREDADGASRG